MLLLLIYLGCCGFGRFCLLCLLVGCVWFLRFWIVFTVYLNYVRAWVLYLFGWILFCVIVVMVCCGW